MQITRHADAKAYAAAKHYKMEALRLQGLEASDLDSFSCGLSYFLPGGGAERSCSANEKVYVVIEGEKELLRKGINVRERTFSTFNSLFLDSKAQLRPYVLFYTFCAK